MRTALTVAALGLALAASAQAQTLQYSFTTTVQSVEPGAPAAFAAVAAGAAVNGTVRFDLAATSAAPNNLGGVFGSATLYPLAAAQVNMNIGGVVLDSFGGTVTGFVWNDQPTVGSGLNDGFLVVNVATVGSLQFQLGNLLHATSVLASNALPSSDVAGAQLLSLNLAGQPGFLLTQAFNPLRVAVVPEPQPWALWLLGLAAVAGATARRRLAAAR